ncbi:hypothetical protein BO71DRAFT_159667 [Aspergillus ellipticus CBS 707.79]|uniref:Uncharacterized protein n=1 Tax=Aspergillus ellipticus CBS 707.79 TaxID=1448320 RepID=A0A319DH52_9EURO|nr:hypothetical protein BO71DRAFT_159667 [Aspergillus ellipticus CBS 707.79]
MARAMAPVSTMNKDKSTLEMSLDTPYGKQNALSISHSCSSFYHWYSWVLMCTNFYAGLWFKARDVAAKAVLAYRTEYTQCQFQELRSKSSYMLYSCSSSPGRHLSLRRLKNGALYMADSWKTTVNSRISAPPLGLLVGSLQILQRRLPSSPSRLQETPIRATPRLANHEYSTTIPCTDQPEAHLPAWRQRAAVS